MADPLVIVGAAASVPGVVEILDKAASTLHELYNHWKELKEADFIPINFIAPTPFIALESALGRLQEWMNTDMDELHHQLVMDLQASVASCETLVRRIDCEIADLQQTGGTILDAQNKIKSLLKNGTVEEVQKMADRQTSASSLLLSARNSTAIPEQKTLLEKASKRKISQQVKDNKSSLYSQRDSTSISSRSTGTRSRISQVFKFDRELFVSKMYEKALRGSLKGIASNKRQEQQQHFNTFTREEQDKIHKRIERELKEHAKNLSKEYKVLILGDRDCAQTFIKSMKMTHVGGFTREEREEYRGIVMDNIMRVLEVMNLLLKNTNIELDETAKIHAEVLSQETGKIRTKNGKITPEAIGAVQGLWEDKQFVKGLLNNDLSIPDSSSYMKAEIQRSSQNDYLPTDADILKLGGVTLAKSGIQEHKFVMGERSLQMVDISSILDVSSISHHTSVPLLRRKWISQFEHTTSIAFFVDLSKYDHDPEALLEELGQTRMVEPLGLFDAVVNSRWFAHTSIILLLCNVGHFGEKLKTRPLHNYFPDYTGGNDVIEASGYLLTWFYRLNRANLKIYSHICEPSNESVMRIVWTSVKGTLRNAKNSSVR